MNLRTHRLRWRAKNGNEWFSGPLTQRQAEIAQQHVALCAMHRAAGVTCSAEPLPAADKPVPVESP